MKFPSFQVVLDILNQVKQIAPKQLVDLVALWISAKILTKIFKPAPAKGALKLEKEILMEQAYDLKTLGTKFKARGLDVAEDALKGMLEDTFAWLTESATLSATPADNLVAPLYPVVKDFIMGKVDGIDGQVG